MIALFDSGYGGLTVLKPIMDLMPEYDYLYLGDNARAPYGNHSAETIQHFSEQAIEYLFKEGASLIIIACNTVSSVALRNLQEKYLKGTTEKERKILGVLIPVAEEASKKTKNSHIGLVGTRATVNSKSYEKEIAKINPKAKVYSKACPLLVPFIEENWHTKPEAHSILKKYLRTLKNANVDVLVLGCTHYPFMTQNFKKIMGKKVELLNCGDITAQSLKDYLDRHPEIESKLSKKGSRKFLTTDSPEKMENFIAENMGMKIKTPQKVNLTPTQ